MHVASRNAGAKHKMFISNNLKVVQQKMSNITNELHPLLTIEVINLLRGQGIVSISNFLQHDAQTLTKICKLKFKNILMIRKHILNKNGAVKLNGLEYYNELLQKTAMISTNHENLDIILGGGFYTGYIYEVCSNSPQHLTHFINKFMIDFLAKHERKQTIMYYDTKLTFNPLWLKYLCDKKLGLGKDTSILDYLLVVQATNIYQLLDALYDLKDKLTKREIKLRIVIIDTLCAVLYSSIRIEKHNMLLSCLMCVMRLLAVECHICFVITNLLTVEQGNQEKSKGNGRVYGGKFWQTLSNVRFSILPTDEMSKFDVCLLKHCFGGDNSTCNILV